VEQGITVFINGITGVFAGMLVLYIAMKLLAVFAGREPVSRPREDGQP